MPLANALPAFTSNPAGLLRLSRKVRIAVDADADLVSLHADGTIADVIVGGVMHICAGKIPHRGQFEAAD